MNEQKNFEKILSSALAGNSELYNELGYAYEVGYGTKKNIVEAVKWYCEAVKSGIYSSYMVRLALLFQNERIMEKSNYKTAFSVLNSAARHNIKDSYFFLGTLYMNGLGTKVDYKKALNYLKLIKKDDMGYMHAQFQIGNIYEYGDENIKDISKAMSCYEKVILPIAKNRLAFLYLLQNCDNNIDIIKTKYRQSYESGNVCEKYALNILNNLNGRKIKTIDNLGELSFEDIDKLKAEFGAVLIKTENSCKDLNTLYSIENIKKLKEEMDRFLCGIDDLNEEENNELDIFMQIYVKIGKKLVFDFDEENKKMNSDNAYESRNLINALLYNKCVCGGFVELLRNALETKGINTRLVFSASHVFLQIKIGENWYYTDPTTDNQFIKKDENVQYCLLSEEDMNNMHINHDKFVKSCKIYPSKDSYSKEKLMKKYDECLEKYNGKCNEKRQEKQKVPEGHGENDESSFIGE